MSTTPLTLAELSKAQAEAEGFSNGPSPTLNQANLYVQDCLVKIPQVPGTPASTVPYYPSSETPNFQLATDDMPSALANNFVILDTALGSAVTPGSIASYALVKPTVFPICSGAAVNAALSNGFNQQTLKTVVVHNANTVL